MPTDVARLARFVRARMDEKNLSSAAVMRLGGPSDTTMTRILAGKLPVPRADVEVKLEGVLEWIPGSVRSVLDGGDPIAIESPDASGLMYITNEVTNKLHDGYAQASEFVEYCCQLGAPRRLGLEAHGIFAQLLTAAMLVNGGKRTTTSLDSQQFVFDPTLVLAFMQEHGKREAGETPHPEDQAAMAAKLAELADENERAANAATAGE